jgi:D-arginine dehydrogenase
MQTTDVIVIGAGIAGAGIAWELAKEVRVLLVEAEERPGFHTTGRSAAVYLKGYGNAVIRDLTAASEAFFEGPPEGFTTAALVMPRGALTLVREDQLERLEPTLRELHRHVPNARRLTPAEIMAMVPALRPDYAAAGILDEEAGTWTWMPLPGLPQGFKARGGQLLVEAPVTKPSSARRRAWRVTAGHSGSRHRSSSMPPAPGPTGGEARRARHPSASCPSGARPDRGPAGRLGRHRLAAGRRHRRSSSTSARMPASSSARPPTRRRPTPATPSPRSSTSRSRWTGSSGRMPLNVRRIEHSWAGLRTFAPDKTPVVGFDPTGPRLLLAGRAGRLRHPDGTRDGRLASRLARRGAIAAAELAHLLPALAPDRLAH